ncbi:MAG: DUF2461 domain-containing protein [Acidimicrobiia bacterium]|nr:DUF2461 domain-containing protein [Acidimicrobiia bacterium]
MGEFRGFGAGATAFFAELAAGNDRTWWLANKRRYEDEVRAPLEALLVDLADEFGEAKVARPNRDTRFSRDKSPYKDYAAAGLQTGPGCGLYLRLSAEGLLVAGGGYRFARDQLSRFRAALDDDEAGGELDAVVATLRRAKADVGGHTVLKTAPRGHAPDHPRIDLLRLDGVTAGFAHPPRAWLQSAKVVAKVAEGWRAVAPLNDWVTRHVGASALEPR